MKILVVSPFLPYPLKSGGHTRVFNIVKHLARRHAVDLVCPVTRTDSEYVPHLARYCRTVIPVSIDGILENRWNIVKGNTIGRALSRIWRLVFAVPVEIGGFYYPQMERVLTALLEARQYNVVQIEYPRMAQNLKPRFYRHHRAVKVLIEHDLSFVPHWRRYNNEKSLPRKLIRYLNYRMHRSFAVRTWKRFDRLVVMSDVDKRRLTDTLEDVRVDVVPNGVDLDSFRPLPRDGVDRRLLFIGGGGHFPNIDALRYCVRDILPRAKALMGGLSLRVIGEGWDEMSAEFTEDASVTFTGFVEDIRPHASGPSILVAPLRIGGGTRLKILEAMALGIPVVSTSVGAEGIPVENGRHVLLADSPEAFAKCLKEIFSNSLLCDSLIGNAYELVKRDFGWEKVAQEMEKVYLAPHGVRKQYHRHLRNDHLVAEGRQILRYHLKMASFRAQSFVKDRLEYASSVRPAFDEYWRNYFWSLFVTWACDFSCSYCIQGFGLKRGRRGLPNIKPAPVEEFLKINRLEKHLDEPIDRLVIQGGEPLLYRNLPRFCENIRVFRNVTIVSNLSHDVSEYIRINRARRDLQINFVASYHHEFLKPEEFLDAARRLRDEGMLDWVDFVDQDYRRSIKQWKTIDAANLSCRPFRFVGRRNGKIYPHKARQACDGQMREVDCFTTFVLISPDANMYNCHAKLYRGKGHLCQLDEFPEKFKTGYLPCDQYGLCQPCQIGMIKVRRPKRQKSPSHDAGKKSCQVNSEPSDGQLGASATSQE